ncbi:MAG: hypothetical protein FWE34_01240 [Defluviitaleaceae bacterium]|nr:hypothetical protein [Defluviitaleaceae bacterium]
MNSNNLNQHEIFETKLALLLEVLSKKREALVGVLNISENQETLYLSPPSDERREFLMEMGKQKQKQIDEVLACDEIFQSIFDGIATEFELKKHDHKDKVLQLQAGINEVLELDVKIRAQEEKGKAVAASNIAKPAAQNEINPASTNYILGKYKEASKEASKKKPNA